MLVIVVLLLLVVTATGTYAVQASTSELQGAGATRTAYQTESMAISMVDAAIDWVNRVGPATLYRRVTLNNATPASRLVLTNLEPDMATGQLGDRLYVEDFAVQSSGASNSVKVVGEASLNVNVRQTAAAVLDVYDIHRYSGNTPGARSDGYSTLYYLRVTYTGRARAELRNMGSAPQDTIDRQITTSTARAMGTSGPFSM